MYALLLNPQNAWSTYPNTKWYWNTHNPSIKILRYYSWLKIIFYLTYQTTEDQMRPNYPTLENHSPHRLWGADEKKTLIKLYKSLIQSKLDYGCFMYGAARKSFLWKLKTIHRLGFYIALGAFTTSPIESLYPDTNERPLSLRRYKFALQYTKLNSSHIHKTLPITASWK